MDNHVVHGTHVCEKHDVARLGCGLTAFKVAEAFGIAFFAYGLGFLLSYVMLRYLTIVEYGDVMVARQALQVVSTILLMGTKNVAKRFLIAYRQDAPEAVVNFIWWQLGYLLQWMLLFCALFSVSFLVLLGLDFWSYLKAAHFHIAYWTLLGAPFYAFFMLFGVYLLAFGYSIVYGFVVQALQSCVWILLVFVWQYYRPMPSGWDMVLFMIVQSVVLFMVVFILCLYCLPVRQLFVLPRALSVEKEWVSGRFYSLLIDLYSALPVMVLLGMVEFISHNLYLAGQMSLCLSLTVIFYAISGGIYPLVFHDIQHLVATGQDVAVGRQSLAIANRTVLGSFVVIGLIVIFFGRDVLAIFGEYEFQTYVMLQVFALAAVGGALYYPLLNFSLIAHGDSRLIGRIDLNVYLGLLFLGLLVGYCYDFYYCMYTYVFFMLYQCVRADWHFRQINGFSVLTLRISPGKSTAAL